MNYILSSGQSIFPTTVESAWKVIKPYTRIGLYDDEEEEEEMKKKLKEKIKSKSDNFSNKVKMDFEVK